MSHKRHVDRFLQRQTDMRMYALGTEILDAEMEGESTLRPSLSLRYRATRVCLSTKDDDRIAVSQINSMFKKNDQSAAIKEVNPYLTKPITAETLIMNWVARSSQTDITEFCRWNRHRTAGLQLAFNRDKPRMEENVLAKTNKLTDAGLFPKNAPFLMEAALGRFGIKAMDSFYSGGKNATGLCYDDRIVLANMYENRLAHQNQSEEMQRTVFHEYIHAVGRDRGFMWGIKTKVPVMRLFEESFVEHATTVAYSRGAIPYHVVDPLLHPKAELDLSTYRTERSLLSIIMEETTITPEELGETYFTPMTSQRGEKLREDLERKIGRFFLSEKYLFAFNDKYEKSSHLKRQKLMNKTIGDAEERMSAASLLPSLHVAI